MSDVVKRTSKNAGDAGEYYVAYMLSRLGISAALTTSGSSAVDIIATIDGSKSISIQVKGSWARSAPRQWTVGNHRPIVSPDFFYVLCNMSEDIGNNAAPEIFVVPSASINDTSTWHHKVPLFKIPKGEDERFKDRWDFILNALEARTPS
ncbi:hypothetical protein [Pantoea ananatis]